MPDIECRTAESMVTKYINHSLSVDELEEFLDHISHCSSCYDELETYFIVHEAIQQLDEPEDGSVLDFRKLLDQDIRKSRRYIRKKRWFHFLTGLLLAVFAILLLIFIIFFSITGNILLKFIAPSFPLSIFKKSSFVLSFRFWTR